MKQHELLWVANSPEWDDVRSVADKVSYKGDTMVVNYSGETEEGGRYAGSFEIALREGVQSVGGEYTVFSPKGSGEKFTQVVIFTLTGQIKSRKDGSHYFTGVWEESGVAQDFRLSPVAMKAGVQITREAEQEGEDEDGGSILDGFDIATLPTALQGHLTALRRFETTLGHYRPLVLGVACLAEFDSWFHQLEPIVQAAGQVLERHSMGELDADEAVAVLRDETSLALEQCLDAGANLVLAPDADALGSLATDMLALTENLRMATLREGYGLCAVLLGVAS
ncbi:hypothetical protein [Chitinimonas sp. JJ19]|uniref:hypothetical protein n=1 Tax=Chitinimonas sp. JJ19 TaxID=3109352 RepID=UPI001A556393|nr:hypothetical protein [Chitinimonas sp.]